MQFDSLQFGGGAHHTTLFLGALHQLILNGTVDLEKINTFGGSSAGSLIALLLTIGMTPKEIFEEVLEVDLEELFLNDVNITNLFTNNGFCYGKMFVQKITETVQKRIPDFTMKSTFEYLQKLTKKTLVISATNLTQKKVELFSHEETPTMSVVYALRLSVSIPLLFQTLQYKNNLYVDGAWFKDIRDLDCCSKYFKKETSLHFVIKISSGQKWSLVDVTTLLRSYFVESYWVVNLEKFPYIIEASSENASYDRAGLLFLYQKGIVIANNWKNKNEQRFI